MPKSIQKENIMFWCKQSWGMGQCNERFYMAHVVKWKVMHAVASL